MIDVKIVGDIKQIEACECCPEAQEYVGKWTFRIRAVMSDGTDREFMDPRGVPVCDTMEECLTEMKKVAEELKQAAQSIFGKADANMEDMIRRNMPSPDSMLH